MKEPTNKKAPVLVAGNIKLTYSVVVCLLRAGHPVTLFTDDKDNALECINIHFTDLLKLEPEIHGQRDLEVVDVLETTPGYGLAIAVTPEDVRVKHALILQLEERLSADTAIAVNMESIPLSVLQEGSSHPGRIIGMNWTEPAHTTSFMELVTNAETHRQLADNLFNLAEASWGKDPYVTHGTGIRARMFAAMVREAFYLVENDYASVEDIDRACRNDAGYYLPFAGNFRYMDLMGTYSYGVVMKNLNPDLSKAARLPDFFKQMMARGSLGMENKDGFYQYEESDVKRWYKIFRNFSYQIQQIMRKYPFNYRNRHRAIKPNNKGMK